MNARLLGKAVLLAAACVAFAGCSQATISEQDAPYKAIDVQEPDFIIVKPVAVTPDQAKKLQATKPPSEHVPTEDESRIGNALSSALTTELVSAINAAGIRAYTEGSAPAGSYKTGIFQGYFIQGTGGSPSRTVGFQIKDGHYGVRTVFNIRETPVHGATIDVKTRLRGEETDPRVNEFATDDAKMIANTIVKELIVPAYQKRGWLHKG